MEGIEGRDKRRIPKRRPVKDALLMTRREFLGGAAGLTLSALTSASAAWATGEYWIPAWKAPEKTRTEREEEEAFRRELEGRDPGYEDKGYWERLAHRIKEPSRFVRNEVQRLTRGAHTVGDTVKYPAYVAHEQLRYAIMVTAFCVTFLATARRFQRWSKAILANRDARNRDSQVVDAINALADEQDRLKKGQERLEEEIAALSDALSEYIPRVENLLRNFGITTDEKTGELEMPENIEEGDLSEILSTIEQGRSLLERLKRVADKGNKLAHVPDDEKEEE